MNTKIYALAVNESDHPLTQKDFVDAKRLVMGPYQELLHAFGIGPFSFDEGIGALMASIGATREGAKHTLNNMEILKVLTYVG